MFKSKLSEYCQKNKLPIPQFTCSGIPLAYSSSVLINFVGELDSPRAFQSRETHTTKKKAENDASEVALNDLSNIKIARSDLPFDPNTVAAEDLQDLVESIIKAVFVFPQGMFNAQNLVPVEYFLLYAGVQSALSRVNPTNRKNVSQAYSYLVKALSSPLQTVLALVPVGPLLFTRKLFNASQDYTAGLESATDADVNNGTMLQQRALFQFVVIPSAGTLAPYEVQVDVSGHSAGGERDTDHGSRLLNCFKAMSSALRAEGNLTISAPLFNPSAVKYYENLSQLFAVETIRQKPSDSDDSSDLVPQNSSSPKKSYSQQLKPRLFMECRNTNGIYSIYFLVLRAIA